MVISLVSGTGTIEKKEVTQQIHQYTIKVRNRFQIDFELPIDILSLQSGQKVKISITTHEPKIPNLLLVLRGETYEIEKKAEGTVYTVFFAGLQAHILVKRAIPKVQLRKPIYLSLLEA